LLTPANGQEIATVDQAQDEPLPQFDSLFRPEFSRAPQPYYQRMRNTCPVMRTPSMYGGDGTMVWVATHRDVEHALHSPEDYSSKFGAGEYIPENIDPPEHLKYRRLLDPLFGPKQMNKLEEPIARDANALIDTFIDRGECDYAAEFAVPLPCSVFLELVGLPLDELSDYLRIKDAILRGSGESLMDQSDEVRTRAHAEVDERFDQLVAERRRSPRDDLLSHLLEATVEGAVLTREELLGIFRLLIVAGLDTVTDSLTCFYAMLGRDANYRRRLVDDPACIPTAIEEMLRYETPVPYVPRVATRDTELGGCPIAAGDDIVLLLGSANTDAHAHERPDVIDFDRSSIRHLAFGGGIHRCLGSHLARLELRVSLREWHRRIPQYHIPEGVELTYAPLLRQVEHLPLVFDKTEL
jgi:cytochrome P450